jgi:diacylglycerol kinase family enzyme
MQVAGRYYILNVSVGVSAHSIRDTTRRDKRRLGVFAYVIRVAGHLLGFQDYRIDLTVDGHHSSVQVTEVLVSNGELLKNVTSLLGSAASFRDGRIEAYVVHGRSLLDYVGVVLRKLSGTPRTTPRYQQLTVTKSITIASKDRRLSVQADGEVIGTTPVTIKVVPQAVEVMLPAAVTHAGF